MRPLLGSPRVSGTDRLGLLIRFQTDPDAVDLRVRRMRHTHSVDPRIRPGVCRTAAYCSRPLWFFVGLPDGVVQGASPIAPQRGHAAGAVVGSAADSVTGSAASSVVGSVADSAAGSAAGSAADSVIGSVASSVAGSVVGSGAGSVAGSVADSVARSVAGSVAGPDSGVSWAVDTAGLLSSRFCLSVAR